MSSAQIKPSSYKKIRGRLRSTGRTLYIPALVLLALFLPLARYAQSGSPFDTGFTALQTPFTATAAEVASLITIVIGGYQFAHGEPRSKRALAGVAACAGIAVLPTNVLTWLWASETREIAFLLSTPTN
jgi:hypothetical protein